MHVDDAIIGPGIRENSSSRDDPATPRGTTAGEHATDGGPSILRLAVSSVLVSVVATVLARRLFRTEESAIDTDAAWPDERAVDVALDA
ncbi:MAG: hypothetical protein ABEJ31_02510 [Haloarculaceae archaeon]